MATEFPRVRGIPSCVNLSTYVQGMSDYELLCEVIQVVNKLSELASLSVITYADPLQWDITSQYAQNTVVIDPQTSTAYLSVQPVPQGVQITNTEYWTEVANIDGIYEQLISAITDTVYDKFGLAARENIEKNSLVWIDGVLYKCVVPVSSGQNIVSTSFIQTTLDIEFIKLVEQYKEIIENVTSELNARISTIIANGTPTQGNTELIDIRTAWNGTAYPTAGDSVRKQMEEAIKSSNIQINSNNYTSYFTDANNAKLNVVWFISNTITEEMVANLPEYGKPGLLYAVAYSTTLPHGFVQYYINCANGRMWYRTEMVNAGSPKFTEWQPVFSQLDTVKFLKSSNIQINSNNYTSYFTDANNAKLNVVWFISNTITEEMVANLPEYGKPGLLYAVAYSTTLPHGFVQYYINCANGRMWYRTEIVNAGSPKFTEWKRVITNTEWNQNVTKETSVSNNTVSIFRKVVCCGDSFTSGHINIDGNAITTNEYFAWPHYLGLLTGNEYINCGKSGANVLTWQTDPRGLPAAQSAGKSQAYIIGLGLNDSAQGTERYVELGTPADIGTNAQTYYGGMSKIIRELHSISPLAKIFVQTMPNPNAIRQQYNDAIRNIVSNYKNTYPVFLLDLTQYNEMYNIPSIVGDIVGGHYTAIGYQQFANILKIAISDYINSNIDKFQNVHLIPIE